MDFVPPVVGKESQLSRIAFWTAEHCLMFERARGAELNVFDPQTKKYLTVKVALDVLDEFNRGRDLFAQLEPDLLPSFLSGANRPSRTLSDGKPIIERGTGPCKLDSEVLRASEPTETVYCSSVLDLSRLEGTVSATDMSRTDVLETLGRMQSQLLLQKDTQSAQIEAIAALLPPADATGLVYWFENWRDRVSKVTQWRGYEAQADLIEQVRNCAPQNQEGICRSEFRQYFSAPLAEYSDRVSVVGSSFQEFLHTEANLPVSNTQHNVPWLIQSQSLVKNYMSVGNQSSFGTNFLRQPSSLPLSELVQKTLGTTGPLYYAAATLSELISGSGRPLQEHLVFNEKTILFKMTEVNDQSATFLLQPGDSGSVLVLGNMPVGVVSTVNGAETSGGAAILPLPESGDEETEAAGTSVAKKEVKSPVNSCR
jgi:hypothetical protein